MSARFYMHKSLLLALLLPPAHHTALQKHGGENKATVSPAASAPAENPAIARECQQLRRNIEVRVAALSTCSIGSSDARHWSVSRSETC